MRIKDGCYNVATFWPDELVTAIENARTLYSSKSIYITKHASDRILQYGIPASLTERFLSGETVEAEVWNGVLSKIITRTQNPDHPQKDICAALVLDTHRNTPVLTTVWINRHDDHHATLHRGRYVSN